MVNLWIDVTDLFNWHGSATGVQRAAFAIIKELLNTYNRHIRINFFKYEGFINSFVTVDSVDVNKQFNLLNGANNKKLSIAKKKLGRILFFGKKIIFNRRKILFNSGDLVLILGSPWAYSNYAKLLCEQKDQVNFKIVHFIYDIIPIVKPEFFPLELSNNFISYFNQVLSKLDFILTCSKSTQSDLEKYLKKFLIEEKPIIPMELGSDLSMSRFEDESVIELVNKKYILCVGTIEIRKNQLLVYNSWKALVTEGKVSDVCLVFVGRPGWLTDDFQDLISMDINLNKIIFWFKSLPDKKLTWLYRNCLFTVFSSTYEGFGLPVVESLAFGKTCLAANVSSMPEAGGDFCTYFESNNESDLKAKIYQLVQNEDRIKQLNLKILESYKLVTWKDTTNKILDLLIHEF